MKLKNINCLAYTRQNNLPRS